MVLFCLKPHQPQWHPLAILQHLNTVVISAVAHEALFREGEVVVFALDKVFLMECKLHLVVSIVQIWTSTPNMDKMIIISLITIY